MSISDQIIEAVDAICQRFGIAIDWTQENVLPYMQEVGERYIRYELIESIVSIIALVAITAVLFNLARWGYKKTETPGDYFACDVYQAIFAVASAAGALAAIMTLVSGSMQAGDIIRCLTFPELQIARYLQGLLK